MKEVTEMERLDNHEDRISASEKRIGVLENNHVDVIKRLSGVEAGQLDMQNTMLKEFSTQKDLMQSQKDMMQSQKDMISELLPLVADVKQTKIAAEKDVKVAKLDLKSKIIIAIIATPSILNFIFSYLRPHP